MIFQATRTVQQAFLTSGIKCSSADLANFSYVEAGFTGDNYTVKIRFISEDNDNDVKMLTDNIAKFPKNKFANAYKLMNELSRKYKYVKFCVDDDGDVTAQYDFPICLTNEAVGKVAVEIALRTAKIVDDAYPEIMKAIWQ